MGHTKKQLTRALAMAGALAMAAPVAQAADWTGVYAGVSLGFAKPSIDNNWVAGQRWDDDADRYADIPTTDLGKATGMLGFHVGFNKQVNNLVWGIEGQYSPTSFHNTTRYLGWDDQVTDSEYASFRLESTASIRGRLGVVMDNTLLYGSVGVAMIDAKFGANTSDSHPIDTWMDFDRIAPVVGFGIEHQLYKNFTVRGEFLHYRVSSRLNTTGLGDGPSNEDYDSHVRFKNLNTLTLGVSYYF